MIVALPWAGASTCETCTSWLDSLAGPGLSLPAASIATEPSSATVAASGLATGGALTAVTVSETVAVSLRGSGGPLVVTVAGVAAGADGRGAAVGRRVDVRDVHQLARLVGRAGAVVAGGVDRDRAVLGDRRRIRVGDRRVVDLGDRERDGAGVAARVGRAVGAAVVGRRVGEGVRAVVVGVRAVENLDRERGGADDRGAAVGRRVDVRDERQSVALGRRGGGGQ